jgi:hypothetical protein
MFLQCLHRILFTKTHLTNPLDSIILVRLGSIRFRPEFCSLVEFLDIAQIHFGHLGILRIVGFRRAEESLEG